MRLGVISRLSLSRKGLCALLTSSKRCSIVLELPCIPEDVEVLRKAHPDVLLLHTSGDAGDFEVISRLRNLMPEIKMLLLLDSADEDMEFQAIRAGVCGCVSNASDLNTLLTAIGAVGRGEIWVSRGVASRLIKNLALRRGRKLPLRTGSRPANGRFWDCLPAVPVTRKLPTAYRFQRILSRPTSTRSTGRFTWIVGLRPRFTISKT